MSDIEKLREVFLSEVDEETLEDNKRVLEEWEQGLIHSQAFVGWINHDISKEIIVKLKESFLEFSVELSKNRNLDDKQRYVLWAKQDAIVWLLSVIEPDAKGFIEEINRQMKRALNEL